MPLFANLCHFCGATTPPTDTTIELIVGHLQGGQIVRETETVPCHESCRAVAGIVSINLND